MELVMDESSVVKKEVHFLPCKIHYDGPSNFKKYVIIDKDPETQLLSTSVLGRALNGKEIKLPENFQGLFATKTKASDDKVFVTSTFESFRAWNFDKIPNKNDAIQKVWDWISISEALHTDDEDST